MVWHENRILGDGRRNPAVTQDPGGSAGGARGEGGSSTGHGPPAPSDGATELVAYRGAMRGTAAAVLTAVLMTGCVAEAPADPPADLGPARGPVDADRVPEFCDELMSTLVPAVALHQPLPPGRVYTRLGPDRETGRRAGLRCQHGVDRSGPRLTVTASEFASGAQARIVLDQRLSSSPVSAPVSVRGQPGALVTGFSSTSLTAVDGDCIVRATLYAGVVDPDRSERALRTITRALLDGVEGRTE